MELPMELEWNIMKFMRHPTADLFNYIVLKNLESYKAVELIGLDRDFERHRGNDGMEQLLTKKAKRMRKLTTYKYFQKNLDDIKFWDKIYIELGEQKDDTDAEESDEGV